VKIALGAIISLGKNILDEENPNDDRDCSNPPLIVV